MHKKSQVAALDGWYTMNTIQPHLIGSCCTICGTYNFPKQFFYCKNPTCDSTSFDEVALSHWGKVWSYTNACYQPPAPYISTKPFTPFTLAAVKLEKEQMIIMGQVIKNVTVEDISIGDNMILVIDTLHADDEKESLIWKWKPKEAHDI